jgi:hypothetical protein
VKCNTGIVGTLLFVMLNLEHIRKQIRNSSKVLKYVAGEGWRRSIGPIFVKQNISESRRKGTF